MSEQTPSKKQSNFVHLHVHSHYSLLDGLIKLDDLIARAKEQGMKAIALTDHGTMYGTIEFYQKAKKAGIKPIIGVEAYVARRGHEQKTPKLDVSPYHIVLLAKNQEGYKNLSKLTTIAHLDGYYYKPRVDLKLLKKYSKGLIALSSCMQGKIPHCLSVGKDAEAEKMALEYQEIFGKDNFYLELQVHPGLEGQKDLHDEVNQKILDLSKKTGVPVVATNDVHYLDPEDYEAHDVLLCIQTGNIVTDQNRMHQQEEEDYSFRSPEKMEEIFKDAPEAISNTQKVADRCDLEFKLGESILPNFKVPEGETPDSYLRKLCYKGLVERYAEDPPNGEASKNLLKKKEITDEELKKVVGEKIFKRFEYEYGVIKKMGYSPYFLIVWDFVKYAKDKKIIVGPGRGSAAGSIVSYALDITTIDPLRYDLLFERFLNPARISMPDIDLDFADDRRDEVIQYVNKKYGKERVSQIITFGTMAARNALRDAGRALGMAYNDVDRIAKMIPMFADLEKALKKVPELKQAMDEDPAIERLIKMAQKLEGVARHASTHAAGVVISRDPLVELVPMQHAIRGDGNSTVAQYPMFDLEAIGLLKMDFLGLSNLTVIKNALRIIRKIRGEEIEIDDLPLDDKKTFDILREGKTTGVFQLESSGMKRYLKELKPTRFEDIIAMVALYRPGPMEWIPDYIKGKHKPKSVKYLHPKLEPILKETYGVAVYQEQVLRTARDLAGFSLGEADVLRKAVGKKIRKLLIEQKNKFVDGVEKEGHGRELGEKLFSFIEPFAGYGFNKAHATCYAMIAYQTAYLKANYPAEFMAALLTSDQGNTDRVAIEVSECRQMDIEVLPPNVNESFVEFGVIKDAGNITFGLGAIKNVGSKPAEIIVEERQKNGKYKDLDDFVKRVCSHSEANKKPLESLIQSGAMDSLGERGVLLKNLDRILSYGGEMGKSSSSGQIDIFANTKIEGTPTFELQPADPMPKKECLTWEKKLLGLYLSDHPLKEMKDFFTKNITSFNELKEKKRGDEAIVGGMIINIHKIITRSNEPMLFVKLADLSSEFEALIFPSLYKKDPQFWEEDKVVALKG
ncbi:DNA polymerase III subunit alpha, partial [Patescibacteria group bacterium]